MCIQQVSRFDSTKRTIDIDEIENEKPVSSLSARRRRRM